MGFESRRLSCTKLPTAAGGDFLRRSRSVGRPVSRCSLIARVGGGLPTALLLGGSWWTAAATAKATTELWVEAAWSTTLLVLAELAAAVATLAVTTWAATATTTTLTVLAAHHAAWRSVRALLLDVGLGDDLGWEMEPLAEVVEALGGEGVVVPLPRELGLEVAARGKGLAGLDDLEDCQNWQVCN